MENVFTNHSRYNPYVVEYFFGIFFWNIFGKGYLIPPFDYTWNIFCFALTIPWNDFV